MAGSDASTTEYLIKRLHEQVRIIKWKLKRIKSMEIITKSQGKTLTKVEEDILSQKPDLSAHLKEFTILVGLLRSDPHPRTPASHHADDDCSQANYEGLELEIARSLRRYLGEDIVVDLAARHISFLPHNPNSATSDHPDCFQVAPSPADKRDQGRFLCISFGFFICCLDLTLEQKIPTSKDLSFLPVISTLKLLGKGIPAAMGLFKVNSRAYMVGGQEFPGYNKNPTCPWDWQTLSTFLYDKYGAKGSSCDTFHLSLVRGKLSLDECSIFGPLNKPKLWPIVEQFGDKIHVIESAPFVFGPLVHNLIPSHEVLDLKDLGSGWMELSPDNDSKNKKLGEFVWNHIVVGDKIYAYPYGRFNTFAVFDSKTNNWEMQLDQLYPQWGPFFVTHVCHIFSFGSGRCVRGFLHGKLATPLYVVIAVGEIGNTLLDLIAVAYLVTPRGQVLCYQPLPRFFGIFDDRPFYGREAKVINVDEDGEIMCAIFQGKTADTEEYFLFISMFTVQEVAHAMYLAPDLESRIRDADDISELPWALEKNFVDVKVKNWYAYKRDPDSEEKKGSLPSLPGLSACFL